MKHGSARLILSLGLFVLASSTDSFGQGCSQCLDSTRATPPRVQAAYRHAIYLLGGAAGVFFVTGTLFLRKSR